MQGLRPAVHRLEIQTTAALLFNQVPDGGLAQA
jgi:hypothetical protein